MNPRREPALILGLIASAVQLTSAFAIPLTTAQQGVLNALAVAAAGLITAVLVRSDQLAPAILGVAQAALALGLAFGWDLSPDHQAVIMSFVVAVVSMFVRTQVSAPAPASVLAAGGHRDPLTP